MQSVNMKYLWMMATWEALSNLQYSTFHYRRLPFSVYVIHYCLIIKPNRIQVTTLFIMNYVDVIQIDHSAILFVWL